MAKYIVDSLQMVSLADAIRTKGGTSASMTFPDGMISAISDIQTGGAVFDAEKYANGTLEYVNDPNGNIKAIGFPFSASSSIASTISAYSKANRQIIGFTYQDQLSSVNLPGCTQVSMLGLAWCKNLEEISLPNCSKIDSYGIYYCDKLSRLALPSCKDLGYIYANQYNMIDLSIPEDCTFTAMWAGGRYSWNYCYYMTINSTSYYAVYSMSNGGYQNTVQIHSNCRVIPRYCNGASRCSSINFSNVSWIQNYAFYGSYNAYGSVRSINASNVLKIDNFAFYYCTSSLNYLNIQNCKYVGANAFYNNSNTALTSIIANNLEYIGDRAFSGFKNLDLTSMDFTKVSYIGNSAFNSNITVTELPSTLTSCKDLRGFTSCPNLVSAHNSVAERVCFYSCINLTDVSLPNVRELIDYGAFAYCSKLTSLDLPNLETISGATFSYCHLLSQISMPNLKSMTGGNNFYQCSALEYLDLPSLEYIEGTQLFDYCSSLSYVNLPNLKIYNCGSPVFSTLSSIFSNGVYSQLEYARGGFLVGVPLVSVVELPKLKTVDNQINGYPVIGSLPLLSTISFENLEEIINDTHLIYSCSALTTAKFYKLSMIETSMFINFCSSISLYFYMSSVPTISSSQPYYVQQYFFRNVTSYSIYVPSSLYSNYINDSMWSYFSQRFVSMSEADYM